MAALVLFILPIVLAQDSVQVDIPSTHSGIQPAGGPVLYHFTTPAFPYFGDILVWATCLDRPLPRLYLSAESVVGERTWEGREWGKETAGALVGRTYRAVVTCEELCTYSISFRYPEGGNPLNYTAKDEFLDSISPTTVPIQLYSDEPQQGFPHKNSSYCYRFDVQFPPSYSPTISLSLSTEGNFTLCVSLDILRTSLDPDQYQRCLFDINSSASLQIVPKDPYYQTNSSYMVLVQSSDFSSDSTSPFTISLEFSSQCVHLQDNVPYFDEVSKDLSNCYAFPMDLYTSEVLIELIPLTGTPNLSIILSNYEIRPTESQFQLSSVSYTYKFRLKRTEITHFCRQWAHSPSQANCSVYMSVSALQRAAYSLTVSEQKTKPVDLPLKTSLSGALLASNYAYYGSVVGTETGIALSVHSQVGQLSLLVSLSAHFGEFEAFPTIEDSDYESWSGFSGAFLAISPEDMGKSCKSAFCTVISAVYCLSKDCKYTITAEKDLVLPIIQDYPVAGSVFPANYAFYHFSNTQIAANFVISLTISCDSDLNLYVSRGENSRPTVENAIWRASAHSNSLHLAINSTDPALPQPSGLFGEYIVAIGGGREAEMRFRLAVGAAVREVREVERGWPVDVSLEAGEISYFTYVNEEIGDFTVFLRPVGLVTLGVTACPSHSCSFPAAVDSQWYFPGLSQPLHQSLSSLRPHCVFLLSLQGCSLASLSITVPADPQILQSGVPVSTQIRALEWQHYRFSLDSLSDMEVNLVVSQGSLNLVVSAGASLGAPYWIASRVSKFTHVRINRTDKDYKAGKYSIGLEANRDSSYVLAVHSKDSYIRLLDNWVETYSVAEDSVAFQYSLQQTGQVVKCRLVTFTPFFIPHVSVHWSESGSMYSAYDRKDYSQLNNSLTFLLPVYTQSYGDFIITVSGMKHEAGLGVDIFQLVCSGLTNATILIEDAGEYGELSPALPKQRFQVYTSEPGLLAITAVPCTGDISLSVTSQSNEDIGAVQVAAGQIQAEVRTAAGLYYITVGTAADHYEGSYQLFTSFYPQFSLRPRHIVAGNNGEIVWRSTGPGTVYLAWKPPKYSDGSPVSSAVAYQVYIARSPQEMDTVCRVAKAQDQAYAWPLLPHYIAETSAEVGLVPQSTEAALVINVIAHVKSNLQVVSIPYTPTELLSHPRRTHAFRALIWLLAVILGTALLGLGALWWKSRTAQSSLPRLEEALQLHSVELSIE